MGGQRQPVVVLPALGSQSPVDDVLVGGVGRGLLEHVIGGTITSAHRHPSTAGQKRAIAEVRRQRGGDAGSLDVPGEFKRRLLAGHGTRDRGDLTGLILLAVLACGIVVIAVVVARRRRHAR